MIDFPRLIVISEEVVVIALYIHLVIRGVWRWWQARKIKHPTLQYVWGGRALLSIGIILISIASITGFVDAWGKPLTARAPLACVAMICLMLAWGYSLRWHFEDR